MVRFMFPTSDMHRDTSVAILADLASRHLIDIGDMRRVRIERRGDSEDWEIKKGTTQFGDKFMKFISLPENDVDLSGEHA
ncbi:hypothetical protein AYO47_00190 [Planctomyces sp. SCGC AG-212-M04]|nr:hypothetical protein AYO47_00190 [Planctomyces sp. SCGC AG-212-M04]